MEETEGRPTPPPKKPGPFKKLGSQTLLQKETLKKNAKNLKKGLKLSSDYTNETPGRGRTKAALCKTEDDWPH